MVRYMKFALILALAIPFFTGPGRTYCSEIGTTRLTSDLLSRLEFVSAKGTITTYRQRTALHLAPIQQVGSVHDMLAILPDSDLQNGSIEVDVAGSPLPGVAADARGFIGVAFHVQAHGSRYENLYLRPTNGRADDQLRRNHATQYQSIPDFPWDRLRKESPGVYESYVDIEPGAWTRIKIVISENSADLYVNGAAQPSLLIKDLKLGSIRGQLAFWANGTTDAYFSNMTVKRGN